MDSIELLCVDDILEIHKEALEIFGGSFGYFRDTETKIKSVLDQQYPHFGYDKYPTPQISAITFLDQSNNRIEIKPLQ